MDGWTDRISPLEHLPKQFAAGAIAHGPTGFLKIHWVHFEASFFGWDLNSIRVLPDADEGAGFYVVEPAVLDKRFDCLPGKRVILDLVENDEIPLMEFRCKPYKRKAKREEGENVILPEGKGQGIWEDNITVLLSYPGGEIPVTAPRKMRKKEFISPELSGQVLRGFDLPLDIEKTNKTIKINYPLDYEESKKAKRRISRSITLA